MKIGSAALSARRCCLFGNAMQKEQRTRAGKTD